MGNGNTVPLRVYIERVIDEREKTLAATFKAHEDALDLATRNLEVRPPPPILQPVTIEYPPPDPDGRPNIWHDFGTLDWPEVDLGRSIGSADSIREQQLELSEGLGVVLFEDEGDGWMLVDAIVDRFNPEGHYGGSWIVRVDWSTFRRIPKPGR
jgi:hypothetical protein